MIIMQLQRGRILIRTLFLFFFLSVPLVANDFRGLTIAPENRCSDYNVDDYHYSQNVEPPIIESYGGVVYGPYTGKTYQSRYDTDIEHIVARSEAHDSGMCSRPDAEKHHFAEDPLNLTLAHQDINRCGTGGKCHKDAAEWLPPMNKCWYANRVVEVKLKYNLTVDQAEADALKAILSQCSSVKMVFAGRSPQVRSSGTDPLAKFDDNGNGKITCSEARAHGIAPVTRDHPAYQFMIDGDRDGIVCE